MLRASLRRMVVMHIRVRARLAAVSGAVTILATAGAYDC